MKKKPTKESIKKLSIDILFDIVGSTLFAMGIYSFAAKADFAPGGISGLSIIINHYTSIPIGVCTLILNIPVILICLCFFVLAYVSSGRVKKVEIRELVSE